MIYDFSRKIIIMKKKGPLHYEIMCPKQDIYLSSEKEKKMEIYSDNEVLRINNQSLKIINLKTIYIKKAYFEINKEYCLCVESKNGKENIEFDITNCIENVMDILKFKELFEYFIFSGKDDIFGSIFSDTYNEYIPLLNEPIYDYKSKIKKYTENEIFMPIEEIMLNDKITQLSSFNNIKKMEIDEQIRDAMQRGWEKIMENKVMTKDDKIFIFKATLPMEYYNEFSDKINYLIYESKYLNSNYIDIWVTIEQAYKDKKKKEVMNKVLGDILLFVLLGFIIIFVFSTIFNIEIFNAL